MIRNFNQGLEIIGKTFLVFPDVQHPNFDLHRFSYASTPLYASATTILKLLLLKLNGLLPSSTKTRLQTLNFFNGILKSDLFVSNCYKHSDSLVGLSGRSCFHRC